MSSIKTYFSSPFVAVVVPFQRTIEQPPFAGSLQQMPSVDACPVSDRNVPLFLGQTAAKITKLAHPYTLSRFINTIRREAVAVF